MAKATAADKSESRLPAKTRRELILQAAARVEIWLKQAQDSVQEFIERYVQIEDRDSPGLAVLSRYGRSRKKRLRPSGRTG